MTSVKIIPRIKTYITILGVAILLFGCLLMVKFIFTVKNITVIGGDELIGTTLAQNNLIFLVSPEKFAGKLKKLNPEIRSAFVTKQYPDTLSILIEKEQPIGILAIANGYVYLTESGKVVRKIQKINKNDHLPFISYYQKFDYNEFQPGDVIGAEDIIDGLFFIKECGDFGASVVKLDIGGVDMLVLKTENSKSYTFTTIRNKNNQLEEFKLLFKKYTIEKKAFTSIDFRFDKPVVQFN